MKIGPLTILSVLNIGLTAGLASMWFDHNAQPLPAQHWAAPIAVSPEIDAPTVALMTDPQGGNPDAYPEILARPIFAPDRRPPPPPPPPTAPPPPDPFASLQIAGLFTGPQGGVLARVDGNMRRVKIGQNIGAWTLKSVEGREATFKQGEQERILRLAYAKLNSPLPPASTAVPSSVPRTQAMSQTAIQQNVQQEQRERLRRRNEMRIANGLPPLTE